MPTNGVVTGTSPVLPNSTEHAGVIVQVGVAYFSREWLGSFTPCQSERIISVRPFSRASQYIYIGQSVEKKYICRSVEKRKKEWKKKMKNGEKRKTRKKEKKKAHTKM